MTASIVSLVDPDPAFTQRIGELLSSLGAEVQRHASGESLLAAGGPEPACIISEMRLPDMTGVELLDRLRGRGLTTPVILVAADTDVATAVSAMRAGALDFIEKPHVDRLLVWHVRRLIEQETPGAD